MKKFFTIIYLFVLATTLYAAEQFPIKPIGSNPKDNVFFSESKLGGSFIKTNTHTAYTVRLNNNPNQSKVNIGASLIDGTHIDCSYYDIALSDLGSKLNETYRMEDEAFKVFKEGVKTAFWIEVDGVKYDSTNFTYVVQNGEVTYTHDKTGISFTVNAYEPGSVPPNGSNPVGQPLPAAWILLLLGGGAILIWQLKKAKKVA